MVLDYYYFCILNEMIFYRTIRLAILSFALIAFSYSADLKNDSERGVIDVKIYKGQCHCASIHFETKGEPLFTQYCHCNKCRAVASASENPADKKGYNYTAAYLTENFEITNGKDMLTSVVSNSSRLYSCSKCKSLIYGISEDPEKQGGIGINANNFEFAEGVPTSFEPVRHIWYQNREVDFADILPKFKDAPKEQFGTGELC